MKIGDKLRKLRGNVSQTKIAQDLEISQTAYNKWESNISRPKISNLIKISKYYDKDLYDIIGIEAKIHFHDSNIDVQNLINTNNIINQNITGKHTILYEKRIADLESEVNFWKERYNEIFNILKK